ncbi:hypothetical protein [Methylocystis heyeri]|uniref:Uncharacterized protein n=1 Tax=Methylocystis heyeri TaxID=391905 RepID=A0A6B8KD12_9HYPH|nr:hypothetical protein [Methylocystis heyeri]QGM46126.1 hypothetical protein H2LOC_010705 [Methylocystis heyeri]
MKKGLYVLFVAAMAATIFAVGWVKGLSEGMADSPAKVAAKLAEDASKEQAAFVTSEVTKLEKSLATCTAELSAKNVNGLLLPPMPQEPLAPMKFLIPEERSESSMRPEHKQKLRPAHRAKPKPKRPAAQPADLPAIEGGLP